MSDSKIRILIISNNALSSTNANGRVMEQLVHYLPDENVSQIYFSGNMPNVKTNSKYLKITDSEKLHSFFKSNELGQFIDPSITKSSTTAKGNSHNHKNTHSFFSQLIREYIWKHGNKNYSKIDQLIEESKPNIIFLNVGPNIFTINIALQIKEKYHLPLVVYTTEDEYFHHQPFYKPFAKLLYSKLRKAYKKLIPECNLFIAFHDGLKAQFDKEFNINSKVIMMSSNKADNIIEKSSNIFTYAGNADRGRTSTLIKIAESLNEISSDYKFQIICPNIDKTARKKLERIGVKILPSVPYKEFQHAIYSSPIVFNIESFAKKDKPLIGATFSCKTADLLVAQSPLLLCGPTYSFVVNYFNKHLDSAYVCTSLDSIEPTLREIINNKEKSAKTVQNANMLAEKSFNLETNGRLFIKYLEDLI